LPVNYGVGQVIDAELVYFDGAPPLRALSKERFAGLPVACSLPRPLDVEGVQARFADLLAVNPWLERWPVTVGPVRVMAEREETLLLDAAGRRMPMRTGFRHGWHLLSLAAGHTLDVFGLWDGQRLDPLTVAHTGRLYSLSHAGEQPVLAKVA
jgi:hypothetical protein